MGKKIPATVSDVLLHNKNTDRTERVVLPITRYQNVLNAPKIVKGVNATPGAPFVLLDSGSEELTTTQIRKLCGGIL